MPSTVAADQRAEKGGNQGKSTPPRVPSSDLAALIAGLSFERPTWRIGARPDVLGGVAVPRLWGVPSGGTTRGVLRHRLALALDSQHDVAFDLLQRHDQAEWLRLFAAALLDIAALDRETIADACGYADDRTTRRAVAAGRRLWAQLPAWPWRHFAPTGRPPREWREQGGGHRLDISFSVWARGERPGQLAR